MAEALTIDDLIAFGRDWARHLDEGPRDEGNVIHLSWPALVQYVAAANKALTQQRERAPKPPRSGGRPPGGMGEMVLRLVANGFSETDALRMAANAFGKPIVSVASAYGRASKEAAQPRAMTKKTRRRRARS